ncbi:MAG: hypothetical protein ABJA71_12735, partial [Ginsengibacter sp.]
MAGLIFGFSLTSASAQSDLSFTPSTLSFSVVQGDANPADQSSDLSSSSLLGDPPIFTLTQTENT